ncbi:MAG TPA: Hpt domain-containing protein [Roseomonas sp.]|nr:Hpt domain-containing protein [Roseomonas sp.]
MDVLDPQIGLQLATELPPHVFAEVLRSFEADLSRLVGEMRQTTEKGDLDGCRRSAHALAGTAASIGAQALERLARQALGPAPPSPDREGLREIEDTLRATLDALRALSGSLSSR